MKYKNPNDNLDYLKQDFESLRHVLSHSLRDPLRLIGITCNKILKNNITPEVANQVKEIENISLDVIEGIDLLKEYAFLCNIDKEFEPVDCNEILNAVKEQLKDKITDTGLVMDDKKLAIVKGVPDLVQRLFYEILKNSMDFKSDKSPHVSINAVKDGDYFQFSIKDNGIGFDPVYSKFIFKPFLQVDPQSGRGQHGMGLAFAKKIIDSHCGNLWCESDGENGSTFYFTLLAA